MKKYMMCINISEHLASLDIFRVYRVIPDEQAEDMGMIRIIDNSGAHYLYSATRFAPVQLDEAGAQALERIPA